MALTLDADPNSGTFNCYSTLAEATDYHSARLHNDPWSNAGSSEKNKALMWATRQLDTMKWRGVRADGTQNLEFPRKGLSYYESDSGSGNDVETYDIAGTGFFTKIVIPDDAVPVFLKDATAELAMYLLEGDTTAPSGTEGFSRIKVDSIDITVNAIDRESGFSKSVRDLVWRFLANSSRFNAPVIRVG